MASETRDIQKHVLPNGLVVITETMPHVRSVSVGVWVRNGSRREVPKRTASPTLWSTWFLRARSAAPPKLSPRNGFRRRHARRLHLERTDLLQRQVLDEHLPIALMSSPILSFAQVRFRRCEKRAPGGLEEIKMDLDNPNIFFTRFSRAAFGRNIPSAARFSGPRKP